MYVSFSQSQLLITKFLFGWNEKSIWKSTENTVENITNWITCDFEKVLTCLNHRNLVRCFHCWTEDPPNGWQDSQDQALFSTDDDGKNKPSFATIFGGSKANKKNDSSSRLGGKPSPISINKEAADEWYLYIQMELVHKEGFISLDKWFLEGHQEGGKVLTLFVAGILQAVEHLHSKVMQCHIILHHNISSLILL